MPSRPQDAEAAKAIKANIGANLRAAREAKGWTQDLAAERLDIAIESYARIERGLSFPSYPTLMRIHAELGITPDRLLGIGTTTVSETTATDKDQAISRISAGLRGLDGNLVAVVEELVRGLRKAGT